MDDFAESEIFDHVESFLLDNYSNNEEGLSGTGRKYDVNSFQLLRKFITAINDKYHTGMGVVDGTFGLKRFSPQKIEEIFYEATKTHMKYGEIVKNLKEFVFFLNEMKMENIHTFDDLHKKSRKFVKFLKKLKKTDIGKKQASLIN